MLGLYPPLTHCCPTYASKAESTVIPAQAGIYKSLKELDPSLRRDDEKHKIRSSILIPGLTWTSSHWV